MDKNMIEFYHDMGMMEDWAYYQLNGKTAQENYNDQHRKMMTELYGVEDDISEIHITGEVKKQK